jgi:hypothetical protein
MKRKAEDTDMIISQKKRKLRESLQKSRMDDSDTMYQEMKKMNWEKYAKQLSEEGYVVIPVLNPRERREFHTKMLEDMKKFPEYKNPEAKNTVFMNSGFGAFGNPSSFHNPSVRALRLRIMHPAIELFQALNSLEKKPRYIEQLLDRLSLRRIGTSTTKESWHRDQASIPYEDDEVFGGWINLDLVEDQYFSGVPKTHRDPKGRSGFSLLSDEEKKSAEDRKRRIAIPPGHWFCFYQNMVHEVVSKKMTYSSLRLYTGFRLTCFDMPLFSTNNPKLKQSKEFKTAFKSNYSMEHMLQTQGVPPLPSSQYPPMYAKMNIVFPKQRDGLQKWSLETFRSVCVHPIVVKGESLQVVDRFMRSLSDYQLPLYPAYLEYEKEILYPRKSWNLPFYETFKEIHI